MPNNRSFWVNPVSIVDADLFMRQQQLRGTLESERTALHDLQNYYDENKPIQQTNEAFKAELNHLLHCVEDNKTTMDILRSVLHLMHVLRASYNAMAEFRPNKTAIVDFESGPIDVFSQEFIEHKIDPYYKQVQQNAHKHIQDVPAKNLLPTFIEHTQAYQLQAKILCDNAIQLCNKFLLKRYKFTPLISSGSVRIHLKDLLREAQNIAFRATTLQQNIAITNRSVEQNTVDVKLAEVDGALSKGHSDLSECEARMAEQTLKIAALETELSSVDASIDALRAPLISEISYPSQSKRPARTA